MDRKGSILANILAVLVGILIVGGIFYYFTHRTTIASSTDSTVQSTTAQTVPPTTPAPATRPTSTENQNGSWQINDAIDDFRITIPANWNLESGDSEMILGGMPTSTPTVSSTIRLEVDDLNTPYDADGVCGSYESASFEQMGIDLRSPNINSSTLQNFWGNYNGATSTRFETNPQGIKMAYATVYACEGDGGGDEDVVDDPNLNMELIAAALHSGKIYIFSAILPIEQSDLPNENRIATDLINDIAKPQYQNIFNNFYGSLNTLQFLSPEINTASWQTYQNSEFSFQYPPNWNLVATSSGVIVYPPVATSTFLRVLSFATDTDISSRDIEDIGYNPAAVVSIGNGEINLNNATGELGIFWPRETNDNNSIGKEISFDGQYDGTAYSLSASGIDLFDTVLNATSDEIISTFHVISLVTANPNAITSPVYTPSVGLYINNQFAVPNVISVASGSTMEVSWFASSAASCEFKGPNLDINNLPVNGSTTATAVSSPGYHSFYTLLCYGRGTSASTTADLFIY